jgi:hypothetical protein
MYRPSMPLPAQAPEADVADLPPEWLMKPANDAAVLKPDAFDSAQHGTSAVRPHTSGRPRTGGLVTTASLGLAIAAAATVLTIGWFSLVDLQSSPNLSTTPAHKSLDPPAPQPASIRVGAPPSELAEGLNALRAQMQAAQESSPTPADRTEVAAAEAPEVKGRTSAPVGTAMVPPAPVGPAAETGAPQASMTPDEIRSILDRAKRLIAVGDIAAARRLAEYAATGGDGSALFMLAETFDPKQLARWRVRGVRADAERARVLYRQALQRGIAEAQARLAALP